MANNTATLKQRVVEAEAQVVYLQSLLDSFWTGDVPSNASFDHLILAKAGRQRLKETGKTPALFQPPPTTEQLDAKIRAVLKRA